MTFLEVLLWKPGGAWVSAAEPQSLQPLSCVLQFPKPLRSSCLPEAGLASLPLLHWRLGLGCRALGGALGGVELQLGAETGGVQSITTLEEASSEARREAWPEGLSKTPLQPHPFPQASSYTEVQWARHSHDPVLRVRKGEGHGSDQLLLQLPPEDRAGGCLILEPCPPTWHYWTRGSLCVNLWAKATWSLRPDSSAITAAVPAQLGATLLDRAGNSSLATEGSRIMGMSREPANRAHERSPHGKQECDA